MYMCVNFMYMMHIPHHSHLTVCHISRHHHLSVCSATGHDIRSAINTLQFAALRTRQAQRTSARAAGAGGVTGGGGVATLGHTLASMISSGLKDEQRDAFQVTD